MVQYDNDVLKTFYTHALFDNINQAAGPANFPVCNWSYADYSSVGIYTEKTGGVRGGLLPCRLYNAGLFDGVDPDGLVQLNCYTDPATNIKLSPTACDYMPSTDLSADAIPVEAGTISVFPNPTSGLFTVLFKKPLAKDAVIDIMDISGRGISTFRMPAGKTRMDYQLQPTCPGIYFMMLRTDNQKYYQKIIIR